MSRFAFRGLPAVLLVLLLTGSALAEVTVRRLAMTLDGDLAVPGGTDMAAAERLLRAQLLRARDQNLGEAELERPLCGLAALLLKEGASAEARRLVGECARSRKRMFGTGSLETAAVLGGMAFLASEAGKSRRAEAFARKSLAIRRTQRGSNDPLVAMSLEALGGLSQNDGRSSRAREFYRQALDIREKVFGPRSLPVARSLSNLASLDYLDRKYEAAEKRARLALAIKEEILGSSDAELQATLNILLAIAHAKGDAEKELALASRIRRDYLGPGARRDNRTINSLVNVASVQEGAGRASLARATMRRALLIQMTGNGFSVQDQLRTRKRLARISWRQGNLRRAAREYQRALALPNSDEDRAAAVALLNDYAQLLREMGRNGEAATVELKAHRWWSTSE